MSANADTVKHKREVVSAGSRASRFVEGQTTVSKEKGWGWNEGVSVRGEHL